VDLAPPPLPRGVSVVIPCYHSKGSIGLLVEQLVPVLKAHAPAFEIILVDDASRDGTGAAIAAIARARPEVTAVQLMRNYGQHAAILCGIRAARFDTLVTMDDDLQHPPAEVPKLLAALTDDVDVVYGAPAKEPHGVMRGLASRVTKWVLQGAMGADAAGKASALRAFRTRLRDAFAQFRGSFVSIDVLLTWGTQQFTHVVVRHDPRTIGTSNYTFRKLVRHAINMMTGFSTIPLQLASWIGFALSGLGVAVFAFVLIRYLADGGASVPGFPFLACTIAVFSGAQLLCLGIIGEYLGRAHFRLLDRPAYQVRAAVRGAEVSDGG
jgi:undecaprenyl-phosphate 4-deoxy-4-formamido-L-arabinose transferase